MMFLPKFIRFSSRSIANTFDRIYNHLLPSICILCGHPHPSSQAICVPCQNDLPILTHRCPRCAQFLSATNAITVCGACQKKPPPFELAYALFPYQAPVIKLIIALKFYHQLHYAKLLGELLVQKIRFDWYKNKPFPELIIPIPLHPKRLRKRGFNQALEIARPVAKSLGIAMDINHVKRIKNTQEQSRLAASERQSNMADAFIANRDYTGLSIAVIDDVITTGYTITEFCKVLKASNNPKSIHVWCCARRDVTEALQF